MPEKYLPKLYGILRVFIFTIPAIVIIFGAYLILFPVESFSFFFNQPEISKFSFEKNDSRNEISFGASPTFNHRYIEVSADLKKNQNGCFENPPKVILEKTYKAFLFPESESIKNKDELKQLLFSNNKTQYPNGSLLHFKPTDEVYVVANGEKILFPGPEIFRAFGYSFENLVDVDKSTLDQFPNASPPFFSWVIPHPDGTIFQAYPSRKLFFTTGGKKREIENSDDLSDLWPEYFTIAVSDVKPENQISCFPLANDIEDGKIFCRFDRKKLSSDLGGYYNFTLQYPPECPVANVQIERGEIRLIPEKSFATIKDSLRKIFASIVNRYYLKQASPNP